MAIKLDADNSDKMEEPVDEKMILDEESVSSTSTTITIKKANSINTKTKNIENLAQQLEKTSASILEYCTTTNSLDQGISKTVHINGVKNNSNISNASLKQPTLLPKVASSSNINSHSKHTSSN